MDCDAIPPHWRGHSLCNAASTQKLTLCAGQYEKALRRRKEAELSRAQLQQKIESLRQARKSGQRTGDCSSHSVLSCSAVTPWLLQTGNPCKSETHHMFPRFDLDSQQCCSPGAAKT